MRLELGEGIIGSVLEGIQSRGDAGEQTGRSGGALEMLSQG